MGGSASPGNLARLLFEAADRAPGAVALELLGQDGTPEAVFTFDALRGAVRRAAGALTALELPPQSPVLLRLGNSHRFPIAFLACVSAGLIAVPSSPLLTPRETDQLLEQTGAPLVICDGAVALPSEAALERLSARLLPAEALDDGTPRDPVDSNADDPAYLIFTSGTGGRPKGVLHAHRAIAARWPMDRGWTGLCADDRLLHAGAFNWTYTLGVGLLDPWRHGATALIVAGDRPSAIWPGVIERARATIFAAVPSVHRQMLRDGDARAARFSSLRHALSAGETLRPVLLEAFTRTTGRPIFEAFGMSEISTYISSGPETPVKPGSPGRAQRGRRVATLTPEGRICDPGELGILAVHRSDPALFLNYFRDGEATQKAFCGDWFLTGDLASIDAQGYVWPQGRADDVMNAFGYRVAPEEVEAALSGHPGVQEIAVTSVPERDGVDLITAFVVPANPETFDPGVLLAYGEKVLARYKRPRKVVVLAHLPRTANGKVMRKRLIDETRF